MALIGKIRKNFWFVLLLLGFALASFVLMDIIGSRNGAGGDQFNMGSVNGTEISYQEFSNTEQILYRNAGGDVYQRRESLWDYFKTKSIVEQEAEALGMGVGYDELMDLQFGQNMSPVIQQNWRNPQTGQLDMQQLMQYKTAIENGQELDPNFRSFWREQEKQIKTFQLQDKISNLVSKGLYTPNWMAEASHKEQNTSVDMAYVKIPYESVDASGIEVTDNDYSVYMNNNKQNFTNDVETRDLEFLVFDVLATSEDSMTWKNASMDRMAEFKNADNDSIFALNNNGAYQNYYFGEADFPSAAAKGALSTMNVGDVYGPYIEDNYYRAVKLLDKQVLPDSVQARHILKNVVAGNVTQLEEARRLVDSLKTELTRGRAKFADLAAAFSDDTSNKTRGGDLGTFPQGRMVQAFNDACFRTTGTSGYKVVETNFGVHLIDVQKQIFNSRDSKYKVAFINTAIIPSQATQDSIYEVAAELVESNPYWEEMKKNITPNMGVEVQRASSLKANDYNLSSLGSGNVSREIIMWAFDKNTAVNGTAPQLYTYTDPVSYYNNKYVATGLVKITEPGMASLESVKGDIATQVMNMKKGESVTSGVGGMDLQAIAAKYNTKVDTVSGVNFKMNFIPIIGNEPQVIGAAFETGMKQVSKPVAGNTGVFVVMPINKLEAGEVTNIAAIKRLESATIRNQVSQKLFDALKNGAETVDSRSKFF